MKIKLLTKDKYPQLKKLYEAFDVSEDGEICISVGGDGTFLQAARTFKGPILPIRGGEIDSLGFHADVTLKEDLDLVIEELKNKKFETVEYPKLLARYKGKEYEALNDVVLFRASPQSVHVRVYNKTTSRLERLYPGVVEGDGIIVAGQLGCTAYNYNAGGSIVYREDDLVVTPICARPPNRFSITGKGDFYIELTKNTATLDYDNARVGVLYEGDNFTVGLSQNKIQVVKLSKREAFSEKLKRLHTPSQY